MVRWKKTRWSTQPQTGFPPRQGQAYLVPAHIAPADQAPAGPEPDQLREPFTVHRLGDLLPTVLALHGLSAEPATPAAHSPLAMPAVLPQPHCPAGT